MWPFFTHHGVLGLNARNFLYIKPFNPKRAIALADDKLKTKAFLAARGVPTAKIYARIESREQLHEFAFSTLPDACVLKPNQGFGGEGIIVFKGRKDGELLIQGKTPMSDTDLRHHIEDIIDGKFSLGGRCDTAFFEQILVSHECFAPFRPAGLPDIRVVVFNLVPVMAMLRIPTVESHGKANVHLGGIGIGVDIVKGVTTHAAQYHHCIDRLPHGGDPSGVKILFWEEILNVCSNIQYITNIGYLAVDMTIDAHGGPMLLEVNARAGLMVQVANLTPLRARLERVEGVHVSSPEKGVRLAQELFGERIERTEEKDNRSILGPREVLQIAGDGSTIDVPCLITPDSEWSVFTSSLIKQLRREKAVESGEISDGGYKVKFVLGGRKIQTVVHEGDVQSASARAAIGRRDLTGFLIDPTKKVFHTLIHSAVRENLRAVDRVLSQIDRKILVLKYLKPLNLREERSRIQQDSKYNPVFLYRAAPDDMNELEERLRDLSSDESPLGILLEKKRQELLMRLHLILSRGDPARLTGCSQALFGAPSPALIAHARGFLSARSSCRLLPQTSELLYADDTVPLFYEILERYGLHDWQVSVRASLVADCTVGRKYIYIRRGAVFSHEHVASLIAHEVETHVLTAENGEHQPFDLLRRGCANYLDTQEGLAIFNQNRVLPPDHEKRYTAAKMVLATVYALQHSFADTRRYLEEELEYDTSKSMTTAIGIKRGIADTSRPGAFTKGIVYFRGWRAIDDFVQKQGDLRRLYVGKIALEDLELIEKIPGLKPPLLLPEFLQDHTA